MPLSNHCLLGLFVQYGPVNDILVLIAYAQMPLINVQLDIPSSVRGLNFDLSLHLYVHKQRSLW